MRHLKTTLAVLGAVTVLVLAGNSIAMAATGKAFILGKGNSANKMTTLKRTTAGSALKLQTTNSAAAPLAVNGRGKVGNLNSDLLDGKDSTAFVQNGTAGALKGYAHILPGGTLDATRSWNVAASNLTKPSTGFYCFHGLGFTPHNGAITVDYNGTSNGEIPLVMLKLPPAAGLCGASAQAEIFTGDVASSSSTVGSDFGYYVLFY